MQDEKEKYEVAKRKVGRPLRWKSPEKLAKAFEGYFRIVPQEEWSITGLALVLGCTRAHLCRYEEKEEYKHIIQRAKLLIEHAYEMSLRRNGRAGDIFALKNFGWRDKFDHELTGRDGGAIENKWTIEVVDTDEDE